MLQRFFDHDIYDEGDVMHAVLHLPLENERFAKWCWPLLCTCADRLSSRVPNPAKTETKAISWAAELVEKRWAFVPLSKVCVSHETPLGWFHIE
jgi:hypothetical protein